MNKVALVTGASEGLGRCFAQQLAHAGFKVVAVARNEERLKSLCAELGEGHSYFSADLGNEAGIQQCVSLIESKRIHLLVNNAGYSQFGLFREADIQKELNIFHVNCHTVLQLSHAFLRQAEAGDGLINLSSITNSLTTAIQPNYCATKCYIASLSESLWYQERERGVYVQALLPGITKTQFIERASDIQGFKMQFLNGISQSPEAVVKASLRAFKRNKGPIVIPGIHNQLISLVLRFLPRKWIIWSMGKAGSLA